MAVSQLQCLDDNHVNPRINESKPEFLYSEDQRLALETLIRDGREAFFKYVESRDLRGFLSDPELETLRASVEPYEADSELFPEDAAEGDPPLSLHYWPDLSDTSIPQMDLGWPDSAAYRGVTRTAVYCQPPIDGQAHIKEVVRRTIAQAQKVIAVAMDVFTDVDIFQDLLNVSFKKKVSVYILLDRTALPHFLSMCQRANIHAGHLKNLRIRCSEGSEFYTRSSTKVKGRLGHRFMLIDGDKAVSGSYSFTWMSSRLDRNLITVVTGQAVEAFDKLFRILYANSRSVDLRQVATEAEPQPEPDPLPLPATLAPPSAAIAMKLYNPKYNLAVCSFSTISSPTPANGQDSPQKTTSEEPPKNPEDRRKRRRGASKESLQEPPALHPCLSGLEKVCLIPYLPTWPEPDPPSDVIGFINIRDTSKPLQAHLQRSEMFETSQVIRFSSPISIPKEVLPLVAKPRELIAKQDEVKKPPQGQTPAGGQPGDFKSIVENNTPDYKMQHGSVRNELNVAMEESDHDLNSATPHLSKHKTDKSEASNTSEGLKLTTQAVTPTNFLILPGSNIQGCESNTIVNGFIGTQTSPLSTDSSTGQSVPAIKTNPDLQSSGNNAHSCSTIAPLITSSPAPANPPSPEYLSPPTPKPRTVQLVFKDGVHDNGQRLQEVSMVRRQQTDAEPLVRCHPAPAGNEPERNNVGPVREGRPGEAENKNAQGNYQETRMEEVVHEIKAKPKSKQASKSDDLRTGATERTRDQEKAHGDDGPTLGHIEVQSGKKKRGPTGFGSDEVTWENGENAVKQKTNLCSGHTLRKIPRTTPAETITSELDVSSRMPVSTPRSTNTLVDGAPRGKGALDGRKKDLRLSIPDREPRTSSPVGKEGKTPTPDPQPHPPDGRSRTPDFKTPTSDFSDGFVSPRTLSSTSDEYYECSDSEHLDFFSTGGLRPSHANPSLISAGGTDVATPDSPAEPASISSSSLLDLNIVKGEDEKNKAESSTTGTILRVVPSQEADRKSPPKAERPDEGGRPSMKRESKPSSSGEEKRRARNEPAIPSPASLPDHKVTKVEDEKNGSELTDSERKVSVKKRAERRGDEEPKSTTDTFKHTQKNKRQSPLNAERLDENGGITDKMEPKPSSTGDSEEGKRTTNDYRDGIKEDLKLDGGAGSPSAQTIPVENGSLPSAPTVTDNTDSKTRRKPPKHPPPPSQGQRQRGKSRQWQNKTPNPPHTHPEPRQPRPDSQTATIPEEESQVDGKTPFTLTFSRLYSLKDMINKLPTQSKRGSTSAPAQSRKSSG